MSKPVNYELLDELLGDGTLPLRRCAELAGCSDWSARRRYRELTGDDRPMKHARTRHYENHAEDDISQPLTGTEKAIAWSVAAIIIVGIVALGWCVRRDDFPHYYPEDPMT